MWLSLRRIPVPNVDDRTADATLRERLVERVLIDDRPVPYARELWLPLVWFLIPR